MRRYYFTLLILAAAFNLKAQEPIRNYSYTFKIANLPDSIDSIAFMANYYGNKQYYFDTAAFEPGGIIRFSGDSIMGGIYSIILQDKKSYFEFVVNEPKIEMETVAGNLVKGMKVKTSDENKNFYEYLTFIETKSSKAEGLKKKLESENEKEKEAAKEALQTIDAEVIGYKKEFILNHPDLFISKVFRASEEPEVADYKEIENEEDRNKKRYLEFKKVYLENVDFGDERLLRTPVLHNKFIYYLTKLTPQNPDSINATADLLAEMARPSKEVFKYVVHTITTKYEDSQIMGMDAVLVHMGQTYYCSGQVWWLSEKKKKEFCERIEKMAPLLLGNKAPNLILQDTANKWYQLYKVNSPYTVLYFWDSGCGHCKKVTPKLKEFYEAYKDKGIEVFAVGTEFETEEWKAYIKKNELPWINVSDNPEYPSNFRDSYDIFSTPKVYLLDADKKIIAAKLMPEQLGEFIDHQMEEDSKKTK